ncbi:hypothetical protein OUZ56_023317 [Daphnia magna]|uniref:Uncharacterized protein n=1 Tax=Daphnia magna TaxID=35525 RepID=A0ABR0AYV8_9CRUS|nr:hypothetical protein OUZ56_023317 [Daphnia magna]
MVIGIDSDSAPPPAYFDRYCTVNESMAAWRRCALELGSGCMCDLMWRCMWEAPSVMFADWSFEDTCARCSMPFNYLLCPTME